MTLTDRYVDAAMRTVPEKQRADLSAELAASIADQIEARTDSGEVADTAERAVLTELGDPEKLAAGYTGRQLHLIGPRYYLDWWRLLKLLMWIVLPSVAFGVALGQILSDAPVGDIVGSTVAAVLTAVLHVAFWTTLVFVILERTGHETMDAGPWTPDRLPEPKQHGATFADMIASIVMTLILVGAIIWDQLIGFVVGHRVSFLNPQLWPVAIIVLFVIMAAGAVLAVAVHVRGRWSLPLAAVNAVLGLAVIGLLVYVGGALLNPVFFEIVAGADAALVHRLVTWIIAGAIGIIAGAIGIIAVWDIIDAFLKAVRAQRVGGRARRVGVRGV
ncbi:hypothetical protein ET475_10790 [Microbacterium protaetiae]|uniref:Uncharacterized protein n=1 Tax=Microbacterium protaetiae TaxID=2509458 RepID=A0A4P6EE54_9MICO|nr:permease prefix domain 1-containing protein [Microbacterium protaetiae]QAY60424.1 hypothetical protein ET475_10790 [Microbacterium protaetiae]